MPKGWLHGVTNQISVFYKIVEHKPMSTMMCAAGDPALTGAWRAVRPHSLREAAGGQGGRQGLLAGSRAVRPCLCLHRGQRPHVVAWNLHRGSIYTGGIGQHYISRFFSFLPFLFLFWEPFNKHLLAWPRPASHPTQIHTKPQVSSAVRLAACCPHPLTLTDGGTTCNSKAKGHPSPFPPRQTHHLSHCAICRHSAAPCVWFSYMITLYLGFKVLEVMYFRGVRLSMKCHRSTLAKIIRVLFTYHSALLTCGC